MDDHAKLKRVIRNRPLCIVLHGHSVKHLPDHIARFPDVCFASLNRYWAIEEYIQPRTLELLMVLSGVIVRDFGAKVRDFPGLLISTTGMNDGIAYTCPGGNTLYGFLLFLIEHNIEQVFLFGADGFSATPDPYVDDYLSNDSSKIDDHYRDTLNFNNVFPRDHGGTKIFNVSIESRYEPFEKITYEECLSLLAAACGERQG